MSIAGIPIYAEIGQRDGFSQEEARTYSQREFEESKTLEKARENGIPSDLILSVCLLFTFLNIKPENHATLCIAYASIQALQVLNGLYNGQTQAETVPIGPRLIRLVKAPPNLVL